MPLLPRAREQAEAARLLTFWPRKRLLVERTVKPSAGVPSVVLSALAALLTSPCFFLHKRKSQYVARTGRAQHIWAGLTRTQLTGLARSTPETEKLNRQRSSAFLTKGAAHLL